MRIISQDGFYDVPYELVAIECVNLQVFARPVVGRESGSICELATYDTREKAIKAMEMLREAYNNNEFYHCTATTNTFQETMGLLSNEKIKEVTSEYFRFPQDNEIEV